MSWLSSQSNTSNANMDHETDQRTLPAESFGSFYQIQGRVLKKCVELCWIDVWTEVSELNSYLIMPSERFLDQLICLNTWRKSTMLELWSRTPPHSPMWTCQFSRKAFGRQCLMMSLRRFHQRPPSHGERMSVFVLQEAAGYHWEMCVLLELSLLLWS